MTRVGETYAIDISYSADDPKTAALIANTFARLYVSELVEAKSVEIATRLAEQAPAATRWTKHTLNHWLRQATPIFEASLALEFIGLAGPEGKEGMDAFLQKRAG